MSVALTYDEFLTFIHTTECHYCSAPIVWNEWAGYNGTTAYNLDRIDPYGIYSIDNCVVCCKRCNLSKRNWFTYHEWVKIGALIRSWKTNE
jgi:hypothetical protein